MDWPYLDEIVGLMHGYRHPWFFAGGWALDLFQGRQTRPHSDVDVAVFRAGLADLLTHFAGWVCHVGIPEGGGMAPCTRPEDAAHPRHELLFQRGGRAVEVLLMLDPCEGRVLFRRDRSISLPCDQFGRMDAFGRPYVAPEWQLLYKAKGARPKDQEDFDRVLPHLDARARAWLSASLRVHQPQSSWVPRLEGGPGAAPGAQAEGRS